MTPEKAKEKLIKKGKTIRQVSEELGIEYRTVQAVLNGTNKGRYGAAHRAAVALGIKEAA